MIDLHTHSTASDGVYSPEALLGHAAEKKIQVLALTDHDTTDGLEAAQNEAQRLGIIFVPGIELTVDWPTGEFHLLGLGLTHASMELKKAIDFLRKERENRNRLMAKKLNQEGIDISYEEVLLKTRAKTMGRPHFAAVLKEKGIIKTRQEAFDRFFAKGRPCYVERQGLNLYDAVEAIKTSGGIPVQAHPLSIYVSWGKIEETMTDIKESGVEGLEAWHPATRISEAERLEALAYKLGMLATGGSDFHGEAVRRDRHLGFTAGGTKIKDSLWINNLFPALKKLHGDTLIPFKA